MSRPPAPSGLLVRMPRWPHRRPAQPRTWWRPPPCSRAKSSGTALPAFFVAGFLNYTFFLEKTVESHVEELNRENPVYLHVVSLMVFLEKSRSPGTQGPLRPLPDWQPLTYIPML